MSQSRNYAFISYNHKDMKYAKWLQAKLESYKLPTEIHNEFEDSRYIRPVFRDQTDLNTGVLSNVLRDQLEASQFLIVICSPNSAKSEWVSKEVQSFIEWGRIDRIIPVIVDGQPNCYNPNLECFPVYLREYTTTHPETELLGVSLAEVGKDKAFIRVVSRMLGVSFDTLWKRHERERRRRIIVTSISTPIIMALLYWFVVPVSLQVNVRDARHQLPISVAEDGTVGVLVVDGTEYYLDSLNTIIEISSLPGYYRGRNVVVEFQAIYYDTLRTDAVLSLGISNSIDIDLQRDETFATFAGTVINAETGETVNEAEVSIDGGKYKATTDGNGHFSIDIAAEDQRVEKNVVISKGGIVRECDNEVIDKNVTLLF